MRYILIETFEDLKTSIRFLFSGIYDSQNFLIQHGSTFVKSDIVAILEGALLPVKNRYGENQDVIISMSSICQHKKDIRILYPYGGTDFGSFMLFVVSVGYNLHNSIVIFHNSVQLSGFVISRVWQKNKYSLQTYILLC